MAEQPDEEESLIQVARNAALCNDSLALSQAIGCSVNPRLPCSLDSPLLANTTNAERLYNRLLADYSSASAANSDVILRALLMVPPTYESSWSAALSFVTHVQSIDDSSSETTRRSRSSLRSCVSDLQSFLQQTVAGWWERERRLSSQRVEVADARYATTRNTPRDWILKMVKQIMEPLLSNGNINNDDTTDATNQARIYKRKRDNDYWMMPLELVTTIVSILHGFERTLNQNVLDCVFQSPNIRPGRLLPWLSLATDLHTFLRQSDWIMLLDHLQNTKHFDKQDLPGLMMAVMSLTTTLLNADREREALSSIKEKSIALKKVALDLLHAASVDPATFSTVTTVFQAGATGLINSDGSIGNWTSMGERPGGEEDSTPPWVKANMMLALLGSNRKSGSTMLESLLSRAMVHTKKRPNTATEGWQALLFLACGANTASATKNTRGASKALWLESVERMFKGLAYVGNGRFQRVNEPPDVLLNQIGRLVYQSLFLVPEGDEVEETFKRAQAVHVVDRAQDWIHAASSRMSQEEPLRVYDVAMVAVVTVVVFCELPMSRSFVIRGIVEALSGEANYPHSKTDIALLNCLVISTIVEEKPDRHPDVWKPIVDLVAAGMLPKRVFFALVQAIARTSDNAQGAILSISRKYLQSPTHAVSWGLRSLDESCDRIQCSLFSLSVLINLPNWNGGASEAWKILSGVIVTNRPPLPVAARTWLFNLLQDASESREYSDEIKDRLFRACLMRLCSFVAVNKVLRKNCICPRSIFTIWSLSDVLSVRAMPMEDLPGLLQLASCLFFCTARSVSGKSTEIFVHLRSAILVCCLPSFVAKSSATVIEFPGKADGSCVFHRLLHCKLLVSLMTSAADFALRGTTSDSGTAITFAREVKCEFDIDLVRSQLLCQELASTFSEQDRPSWLSKGSSSHIPFSSKAPAVPHDALQSLASSLCNSISMFVGDYRWSFITSDVGAPHPISASEGVLLSMHNIHRAKAALSGNESGSAGWISICHNDAKFVQKQIFDTSSLLIDAAVFLESTVRALGSLADTTNVLGLVVDRLQFLKHVLNLDTRENCFHELDLSPLLCSLWHFYSIACDESASIRLINYLERMTADFDPLESEVDDGHPAAEPEIIDVRVRRLRCAVLSTNLQCLQIVLELDSVTKLLALSPAWEGIPASKGCRISFGWSADPVMKPGDFLIACMRKMTDDLEAGLQGQSGGVSVDMYTAFLDSMDAISKLLMLLVKNGTLEGSALQPISAVCHASATMLRGMLCSFPPEKQTLFSKAMLVIAESLPVLGICASQESFLLSLRTTDKAAKGNEGPQGACFAVDFFKQCVDTLEKWVGPETLTWATLEVADVGHEAGIGRLDDDGVSTDTNSDTRRLSGPIVEAKGVPSVVTIICKPTPTKGNAVGCSESMLALHTKERWSLACSTAIQAMESIWIESSSVFRRQLQRGLPRPCNSTDVSYFHQRTLELTAISEALSAVFTKGTSHDSSCEPQSIQPSKRKFIVEAFPASSKLRICSLINRIVTATDTAIRLLDSFIRQPTGGPSLLTSLEAASIVLVWFNSAEQHSGFDFALCIRKWCAAEVATESMHTRAEEATGKLLKVFPKLIVRTEKLESNLHQLNDLFLQLDNKKSTHASATAERLEGIDMLLKSLAVGGLRGLNGMDSFRMLVEVRAQSLVQSQLEHGIKRRDDPLFCGAGASKRKRSKVRPELRRRPIRSRNQTVDQWLRSDEQFEDDGQQDDAYLDLENFIVDG
jgi:hypothetical protein